MAVKHYADYAAYTSQSPDQVVEYTYDYLDRRICRSYDEDGAGTNPDTFAYQVHRGDELVLEFSDQDGLEGETYDTELAHRYLYGPAVDQILAVENGSGDVLWGLADHQGTVREVVEHDSSLQPPHTVLENHVQYDAFGRITSGEAAADFLFAFTGRPVDPDTGIYDYRARWYDPEVGRFLSEDPAGLDADVNLYRYAGNSPVVLVDPSGLRTASFMESAGMAAQQGFVPAGRWVPSREPRRDIMVDGSFLYYSGELGEPTFEEILPHIALHPRHWKAALERDLSPFTMFPLDPPTSRFAGMGAGEALSSAPPTIAAVIRAAQRSPAIAFATTFSSEFDKNVANFAEGVYRLATDPKARQAWVDRTGERWCNVGLAYGYTLEEIADKNSFALFDPVVGDMLGYNYMGEALADWDMGARRELTDVEQAQRALTAVSTWTSTAAAATMFTASAIPGLGARMYPRTLGAGAGVGSQAPQPVARANATEGIYEFTSSSGKQYVGQSGNIPGRINRHLRTGKLLEGDLPTVRTTEVLGGEDCKRGCGAIADQRAWWRPTS